MLIKMMWHGKAAALLLFALTWSQWHMAVVLADDAYPSTSDNKLLCMAEMVSNIENSCSKPDIQGYYVALENLLKEYLGKCFHTNFTQNRALHVMMPDLADEVTNYLKQQAENFKTDVEVEVVPTFVPASQINSEVEFMLQHNLANSHDGWILDPMGFASVWQHKGFLDLTDLVVNTTGLDWTDILPFFRNVHSKYSGQVVALPLDGNMQLLFYRKDLFQAYNLTVPQTWPELLELASYNFTKPQNQTLPDLPQYGICIERRKDCHEQAADLITIVAPYLQYAGTQQGVFFDPEVIGDPNKQPALVDNNAMSTALTIYGKLANLSPGLAVDAKCDSATSPTSMFAQGNCLMIFGTDIFKRLNSSNITRGNLGVAPTPGSYEVYDRTSRQLVSCTPDRCPHAEKVQVPDSETPRYLNRAPFAANGGWVAAVNARSPEEYQNYSFAFYSYISRPDNSWDMVLNPAFEFEPYRVQHFDNRSRWYSRGYNVNDTDTYLDVARGIFDSYGNIVLDLRVDGTKNFRDIYESAAANITLLGVEKVAEVMDVLNTSMVKLLADTQKITLSVLADQYRTSIGFVLPPSPPSPSAPPGPPADDSGGSPSWLPIAIVLPTVGALLLIAAGVVYEVRNNRKHKNLFGKVVPPGMGPDTSILVTDVQDSSALWEALPPEVMDKAIKEHHECIRRLLLKHSGYESATEGDSFILAFHSPKDALLFSMDAQNALLHVDWPQELLDVQTAAPVYVQGMIKEAKPKNLQDILDTTDTPLPTTGSKIKALAHGLGGHETNSPTIPALVNVPTSETYTFAIACQRAWKETGKEDPNKVLIFRGLRVRMGIHAGIHNDSDVTYNRADARTHYSGETIVVAKAVADAAHGGMVLISEETYKKLPLERLWDKYLVLHVGEHRLKDTLPNLNLYHALNRTLEGRLAYLGPTRSISQLDPGVLDAPVGCVTIAFMNVVGAQTLLSWNADVAQQALKIFHGVVGEELKRRRGYLVEAVDGLFLAAFQRPSDAILWALECNEAMIKQDWPEDLLSHELCEELVISAPTKEGEVVNTVVFRGLRLKTGVDTGQVLGEVHAMTGRMTYRGKVMNRAARIASTASTGQVLCSSDSWALATTNDQALMNTNKVTGTSLGQFRLKGVAEKIEIYHCRKVSNVAPARRASSLVMTMADHWRWEQNMNQAIGPEDIILGPADSIRAAMMSPRSFTRTRTGSFRHVNGNGDLSQCALELGADQLMDEQM